MIYLIFFLIGFFAPFLITDEFRWGDCIGNSFLMGLFFVISAWILHALFG